MALSKASLRRFILCAVSCDVNGLLFKVKALTSLDRCIGNDYQYMEAYMEKGFIYYDTQQPDKAIAIFNQAIEIRPTYADAFYWLGKTYEQKGSKESAVKEYQRALVLDPSIQEAKQALQRLGAS